MVASSSRAMGFASIAATCAARGATVASSPFALGPRKIDRRAVRIAFDRGRGTTSRSFAPRRAQSFGDGEADVLGRAWKKPACGFHARRVSMASRAGRAGDRSVRGASDRRACGRRGGSATTGRSRAARDRRASSNRHRAEKLTALTELRRRLRSRSCERRRVSPRHWATRCGGAPDADRTPTRACSPSVR